LRQRALYSDDCNRLQQTATDYNRKKAHLCVKEPCIPMTATDHDRLQQTATDCNSKKAHLCVKEPCIQMTATDCNRLQQTATDCNRKKAHLCVKEPCIPTTATDCNRLQQTATDCNRLQQKEGSSLRQRALYSDEKEPYTSSNDQATSLCPISLLAYLSIHASIYLCVSVSMRVRVY